MRAIKGIAVPRLPRGRTEGRTEVAQLKLNADWVVLSACNTIAGDKPGAEALRRAILAYMDDKSDPRHANPAYWAPFVVVGEGAAR